MKAATLIIGIGHADRGDDAVGLVVAERLRQRVGDSATVIEEDGEGGSLLDRLSEAAEAIVIDAALSGAAPGTILRLDAARELLPAAKFGVSSHGFGLADAIALGRVLGRLPGRCVIYAVEAEQFELGAPLSPAVAAAADEVVERVLAEMRALAHA